MRSLEQINESIREGQLRGPLAGGLAQAADEHRGTELPSLRLVVIKEEIAAAAKRGDTGTVRRLKSEKKSLTLRLERETEALLMAAKGRQIAAPAPGEGKTLGKRAQQLGRERAAKQGQLEKLLARLTHNPESEALVDKIDLLRSELPELESELRGIEARQTEIERWHAEEKRREDLAAKQREWERRAPERKKDRARLEAVANEMAAAWKLLGDRMQEIDLLREKLRDPKMPHADPAKEVCQRICEVTGGFIVHGPGGWIFGRSEKEKRQ